MAVYLLSYTAFVCLMVIAVVYFLVRRRGKFFVSPKKTQTYMKTYKAYQTKRRSYHFQGSDDAQKQALKREMQQLLLKEEAELQKISLMQKSIPTLRKIALLSLLDSRLGPRLLMDKSRKTQILDVMDINLQSIQARIAQIDAAL